LLIIALTHIAMLPLIMQPYIRFWLHCLLSRSDRLCKLSLSLSPPGSCQRSKTYMTKSDSLLRRPKRRKVFTSSWYVFISSPLSLLFSHPGNTFSTTPCPKQSNNKNNSCMPSVPWTWNEVLSASTTTWFLYLLHISITISAV